jgi:hypothetical protein
MKQIHTKAIKSVNSETSVYALRKIIHLDMRQKKTRKKRGILMECHSVRAMRILYLRN